jgi:hypothetical protein
LNLDRSTFRNIEWGPWIIGAVGVLLFLLGAARFTLLHRFGFMDALYCCLALVPAVLLLFVTSYVVQHATLASIAPLGAAVVLAISYPVFDVALGLALMGIIAESKRSERKCEEAFRKYNEGSDAENEVRK